MWVKAGTKVVSSQGDAIGSIDRMVIDPRSKEVTHLVVRRGVLLQRDKVLPVRFIEQAGGDQITLRRFAGSFEDLPDFEETSYVALDEEELLRTPYQDAGLDYAVPYYFYPGIVSRPLMGAEYLDAPTQADHQALIAQTGENIPADTVAVKQGSPVYSQDGKHLGDLEELLVSEESGQATHFVLEQGLLVKRRKLVPMDWVERLEEDRLTLSVGSGMIDRLRDYPKQ